MAKKEIKKATAKKVFNGYSKYEYKALRKAVDECKMHHLFGEDTVSITCVDKARRVIVEYVPDCFGFWVDELQLICTAIEFADKVA